jgi:glycosyltransferase involved in cell wall biosynthesis
LRLRNKILRKADAFVAGSSAVASELVVHGVDPRLIYPIPHGVDTTRFCPATPAEKEALRQKLRLPAAATIVTFAGRLVNHNGLPLLLRVWCEIARYHEDVRLLLVGSGESDAYRCEAELREFVRFHRLENNVLFIGSVPNAADFLRASDIFVFPVENEVFDSTLIEAMACGLPVIATAVSGIKKILQQGRSGLVVDVGNFNQLFQALETLINHPHGAYRLGQIAHQTVQQHYTAEAIIEAYARLFYAISNERRSAIAGHDGRTVFPGQRRGVN